MDEASEDLLAALATEPWRPRSLRPPRRDEMRLRLRLGLLAGIVAAHVLGTIVFLALVEPDRGTAPDEAIVVDFIDLPPPPPPDETVTIRMPAPAARAPAPSALPKRPPTARPRARARPDQPMQVVEAGPRPLQLYNPDGSLRVPEHLLDELDKEFGDKRVFSYQVPHMDDARKYFDRNPALVYEETRFDQYWTPDADALTALLTRLAEATTKEVRMKVPGSNGSSYMVCKVSILALGGGCGVVTNGSDWNGPQDDPDTLSPEEDRQCAAWWRQLVGAKTQDAWRATRTLYDRECRKPKLRPPSG